MKRGIYLTILLISFSFLSKAQESKEEKETKKEEVKRNNKEEALAKNLSFISTGNSFSSLGNFASISTDEKTIKGSVFLLNKDYNMYTITFEAGATGGIGALFDEGSQGANVALGVEHRFLLKDKEGYVSKGNKQKDAIDKDRQQVMNTYNDSLLVFFNRLKSLEPDNLTITQDVILKDTIEKIQVDASGIKKVLPKEYYLVEKLNNSIAEFETLNSEPLETILKEMKDSLEQYQKRLNRKTNMRLDLIISEKKNELLKNKKKELAALDEREKAFKTKLIDLEFFAIGAKVTNKSFKFFDENLSLDKQVATRDYTSKEINLSYASVRNIKDIKRNKKGQVTDLEPSKLRYFSVGTQISITDNQDDLTAIEVQDTKFNDTTNDRVVLRKQDAKIGEYMKDLKAVTLVADYYQFFRHTSNSWAVHLNPRYIIKENSKPVTQLQIGLLFPFKKKDDEKATVNIEIFYQLKDVFDTLDKFEDGFFKRNIVGIQTSFPFNFNF
jgi:hypothetical protein